MGSTDLVDQYLSEATFEESGTVHRGKPPTVYKHWNSVLVGWHQKLQHNGAYRMDLELMHADIALLFRTAFGDEITPKILNRYGLRLSPQVDKAALSRVKLGELTLEDLKAIVKPAAEADDED